ncbi:MAG: hypothetical protein KIS92_12835 [Planctomycetota bacterium]|nr:hypothetical protein [Planctomycetota bacterium]
MRISFCSKCGKRLTDMDLQGSSGAENADAACRDCTQAAVPVAPRNLPSDSKIKAASRRQSEVLMPPARKSESGQVASAGGPGGSSWPKEKYRRPAAQAPRSNAIPIVACVTTVLAIVLVYALTRGKPEEKPAAQAPSPAPAPSRPPERKAEPPARPAPPAVAEKTVAPPPLEMPPAAEPLAEPAVVSEPKPKDPPKVPIASDPPKAADDRAKTAEADPKALDAGKVADADTEAEEEEVLPAKPVKAAKEDPAKPAKAAEPPPPVAVNADAAKRRAEFEAKLRKGEWVALFTAEDLDRWDVLKPGVWKMSGDTATGTGRMAYKDLEALPNYEMTAEVSVTKGASMNMVLRHDADTLYRLVITEKTIEGQMYDVRQKKVKRVFEKATLDEKAASRIHVQSKGKWLRAILNEKEVLIEYADVPSDVNMSFYFWASTRGKGVLRNVQFRPLF